MEVSRLKLLIPMIMSLSRNAAFQLQHNGNARGVAAVSRTFDTEKKHRNRILNMTSDSVSRLSW